METRRRAIAERVLESGWLVALAAVPVFFNRQSVRIFDADKVALLRSIALVMLPFLVAWLLEARRQQKQQVSVPLWRLPLVKPAMFFVAVLSVATILSIAPRISFFGSYHRMQGLYAWLSYVMLFLCILLLAKRSEQVDRIVDALLVASFAAGLYALLEYAGFDPANWMNRFSGRIGGTLGNPIFLGGFLIMVVPLTMARAWEHGRRLKCADGDVPQRAGRRASRLSLASYVLFLSVQLAAFLLSASRGPALGFAAGAGFSILILVVRSCPRWFARLICGIAAVAILALGVWGMSIGPSISKHVKGTGTVRVRLLIWEGAGKVLSSNNLARAVIGHGPETIYYTFSRAYPPELAYAAKRGTSADRCHNETFDALLTTGVLGLLAETTFFLALIALLLGQLGIVDSRLERTAMISASGLGGAAGWVVPYLASGTVQLSGIGLPAGLLLGLTGFLLVRAGWGTWPIKSHTKEHDPLLIGLLAGVVAHFIEIQFGIATVATRLCYWAFAGLSGALALRASNASAVTAGGARSNPPGKTKNKRAEKRGMTAGLGRPEVIIGLCVGLSMLMVTFGLYGLGMSLPGLGAILSVCFAIWILGAMLAAERTYAVDVQKRRFHCFYYAAASLGTWLPYFVIDVFWMRESPSGMKINASIVTQSVMHLANGVVVAYVFLFLMLALMAWSFWCSRLEAKVGPGSASSVVILTVLLIPCALFILHTNLDYSRADVVVKQASGCEEIGLWDAAIILRSQSLLFQPDERAYRRDMAVALTAKAENVADLEMRRKLLEDAQSYLLGLWQETRAAYDDAWNLARLFRTWISLRADAADRTALPSKADEYYRKAIELFPSNVNILNDWAAFFLERSDPTGAIEQLKRSLRLDDGFYETYLLLGKAHMQERSHLLALQDYDHAIALAPESAAARDGRARVLRLLQQSGEATINVR